MPPDPCSGNTVLFLKTSFIESWLRPWQVSLQSLNNHYRQGGDTPIVSVLGSATAVKMPVNGQEQNSHSVNGQDLISERVNSQDDLSATLH